jgi:hypothetical protein
VDGTIFFWSGRFRGALPTTLIGVFNRQLFHNVSRVFRKIWGGIAGPFAMIDEEAESSKSRKK